MLSYDPYRNWNIILDHGFRLDGSRAPIPRATFRRVRELVSLRKSAHLASQREWTVSEVKALKLLSSRNFIITPLPAKILRYEPAVRIIPETPPKPSCIFMYRIFYKENGNTFSVFSSTELGAQHQLQFINCDVLGIEKVF